MADDLFGSRTPADVERIRVEALGEPGSRRFRLMAIVAGNTHIVWMEKQQLQALGLAVEQLMEQMPDLGSGIDEADSPLDFNVDTQEQFRVGRIELGYDVSSDRVVISTFDLEQDDEEEAASLMIRLTRRQSAELSTDAALVVSAGRPFCPMCGNPISSEGHVCPQQNGHLPISLEGSDSF